MQYPFYPKKEKEKIKLNIGFAGGMTRLSTGYTFNIQDHSKYIVNNIETIKIQKLTTLKKYMNY